MAKKRMDAATLRLMNLDESPESERLYEFDDPITSVKIFTNQYAAQADPRFGAVFYNGDKKIKLVEIQGNYVSRALTVDYEDDGGLYCADPRLVATYILGSWLDIPFSFTEKYDREKELTEALNPVFTREEALEWLEKSGFIGVNNYNNPFHETDRSKWFIKNPRKPGFDIYYDEPDIPESCVPPKAKKLYNKYIGAYRAWKKEQDALYGGN